MSNPMAPSSFFYSKKKFNDVESNVMDSGIIIVRIIDSAIDLIEL